MLVVNMMATTTDPSIPEQKMGQFSEGSNYDNSDDEEQEPNQNLVYCCSRTSYLPKDYVLHDYDVICGRGRTCFHHAGNVRFRTIVANQLERYLEAKTKTDKTIIIQDIIQHVRSTTPTPGGGFVKYDKTAQRYFVVGDFLAREKTSQAFRDILHEQYKSSNAKKREQRKLLRERKGQTCLFRCSDEQERREQSGQEMTNLFAPRRVSSSTNSCISDAQAAAALSSDASDESSSTFIDEPIPSMVTSARAKSQIVPAVVKGNKSSSSQQKRKNLQLQIPKAKTTSKIWWETDTGAKTTSPTCGVSSLSYSGHLQQQQNHWNASSTAAAESFRILPDDWN